MKNGQDGVLAITTMLLSFHIQVTEEYNIMQHKYPAQEHTTNISLTKTYKSYRTVITVR